MSLVPTGLLTHNFLFFLRAHISSTQAMPALFGALAEKRLNRLVLVERTRVVLVEKEIEMTRKEMEPKDKINKKELEMKDKELELTLKVWGLEKEMAKKDHEIRKLRTEDRLSDADEILENMTEMEKHYARMVASQKEMFTFRLKRMRQELFREKGVGYLFATLSECFGSGAYLPNIPSWEAHVISPLHNNHNSTHRRVSDRRNLWI